jgi:hypothetical protein
MLLSTQVEDEAFEEAKKVILDTSKKIIVNGVLEKC